MPKRVILEFEAEFMTRQRGIKGEKKDIHQSKASHCNLFDGYNLHFEMQNLYFIRCCLSRNRWILNPDDHI